MKKKININLKKSEKLFRNFIRDLRKKTADETAKSEMMTKLNQKKMRQNRNELYTINYKTQVQK